MKKRKQKKGPGLYAKSKAWWLNTKSKTKEYLYENWGIKL